MGKWKAIVPFILALAIAFLASVFLYKWIREQNTPQKTAKVENPEAVPVVVAVVDLVWGTKLKPEMLKTLLFLKGSLPPGHFSDPQKIQGRVTITPLKQNEAITESRLAPVEVATGGVSAVVKPGKRAVAAKGDKVIGIAGFINPGNRVDVLVTMTDPRTKSEITKVVLENILVLATGTQLEHDAQGKPAPVDVYTLEVTPEEGEKLGLAATHGVLRFALKNTMDTEVVLTTGATIPQALASYSKKQPKPPAKKVKSRKQSLPYFTVEIIKGGQVTSKKIPAFPAGEK
jgi:pilus assembly protein CpaB